MNPYLKSYMKLDDEGFSLPDSATLWTMVKDNFTGLIWEAKTDNHSIHRKHDLYTWQNAQDVFIKELNNLNFGGCTDWRLPTIDELLSIVDKHMYNSSTHIDYFPNSLPSVYWSSTTNVENTSKAFFVDFSNGHVGNYRDKLDAYYVRAVRGGQ